MKKYWYFGVRRTRLTTDATGRSRNEQIIAWGRNSYGTREEAIRANFEWWCHHDEDPIVRGFDRQMKLNSDGTAAGWIEG